MNDTPQPVDAKTLRYLRLLVTVLTTTMILGLLVIITLFVIRFSGARESATPVLPEEIALPAGTTAQAFTQGDRWYAIVTGDDRILIYSRSNGALMQEIDVVNGD
ncbi:DUF6476 family protein [Rhodobacteraceae bacterium D3-12]|nr:DUF6476 family protein [Rhodobacteraceae bacterium D3-12]